MLSNGWVNKTVGDLIQFEGGSQPPRDTFIFEPKSGYIRLLQIRDYKTDKFATYIPLHLARKFCDETDIMIGRYGPPIFQILRGLSGAYNVALIKAIPNEEEVIKNYAYYFLKQDTLYKLIDSLSQRTSGQTGIDMEALKNYPFPLPSKDEQKKIVSILSSIDKAIKKTESIIEQTEKVKKGLMQLLLTKGVGHTKFKKTEIGELPEEWEVRQLGTIGTWSGGGTPSKQEPSYWSREKQVIWVSPKDMYSNIITSSEDYITDKGLKEKKLKLLPKGTILFVTRSGILRNRVPIAVAGDSLTINQDLKALQVSSNVDYEFIFYTLVALNDSIRTSCVKTGTTVESIDFQALQKFSIPVPSLSEQKKIVKLMSVYYKKLENEKAYLEHLVSLKKGLMQSLLTGKVHVKVDEVEVTQV